MALDTNIGLLIDRIGDEFNTLRSAELGDTALLETTATNVVAAINELQDAISGSSGIDDETTGPTTTWSSSKIDSEIDSNVAAAVAALVDGAPTTLDTLNELAAALADTPDAVAGINTALGLRVRVDASQAFNGTQQTQGRANIAAASAADVSALTTAVGDTEVDLVAAFEAALD